MQVIPEKCTGCGICVGTCPNGAIQLVNGLAILDQATCTGCQACMDACPEGAITAVEISVVAAEPMPVQPARKSNIVIAESVPVDTKPWLFSALAFAGREILPRLADALLNALDRRLTQVQSGNSLISLPSKNAGSLTNQNKGRSFQRRYRARLGRQHGKGFSRGTGRGK